MTDGFSREQRSFIMSRIVSSGNLRTEVRLISILRKHKITGWRRGQNLPGMPDVAFTREKIAIFVDGCFWHSCPYHGHIPKTNQGYWIPKLARNRRRDRSVQRELCNAGWLVLRIWEHALNSEARVITRLRKALDRSSFTRAVQLE